LDIRIVEGNLLDQDVEVIVNAWNRNIIPWWLLAGKSLWGLIISVAEGIPESRKNPSPDCSR
jgi:hypothetical protein